MRKRILLLGMLLLTTISLCACDSTTQPTEKNNITEITEQQSNNTTSEENTTEIVEQQGSNTITEDITTEETTTVPKITQCQDITNTTYIDIFTLEGIDGPKPKEFSFGTVDVFSHSVPTICKWDSNAQAFFAENNASNENNEYFAMHVDAGHVADDDSYEKCLANFQAQQLEDESNGNECHLNYSDTEKNLAYYSMKKEYATIDEMNVVKYNIRIAYYMYYAPASVYTNYYFIFDYEITKPLDIENIEKIVENLYGTNVYEYDICMSYGLMPK